MLIMCKAVLGRCGEMTSKLGCPKAETTAVSDEVILS